jgi:UDP:flavonoid glycosyltransferase YjiC (YdhE family)
VGKAPGVDSIRDGVSKVLDDQKYRQNAVKMSKLFEQYDVGKVFDGFIQYAVREWTAKKRLEKG